MKNYLIIAQVWFQRLEEQQMKVVQAESELEAEAKAERFARSLQGWSGNKTHWVVLECDSDGTPKPPDKPLKLTLKERFTGKLWRRQRSHS